MSGNCAYWSMTISDAGLGMAQLDMNMTLWDVAWTNCLQGFGTGIIFVPATMIAFSSLPNRDFAEASAVFHKLRNMGSSIFISISVTLMVTSTAANYAGFTEFGCLSGPVADTNSIT